ncbi:MAG: hypothetical protein ABH848_06270 [Candidatus Omnitrophota bacterium]
MAPKTLKKEHIEYILIGVFLIAAIILVVARFGGKNIASLILSSRDLKVKMEELDVKAKAVPKAVKAIPYSAGKENSPFRGPFDRVSDEATVSLPSMNLEGMVWNSIRPQAIINNSVFDVGDVIVTDSEGFEAKIIDITREGIHIKYKEKLFTVRPKIN